MNSKNKAKDDLKQSSGQHYRLITGVLVAGSIPTLQSPFLQTCSEVGKESYEFSPRK